MSWNSLRSNAFEYTQVLDNDMDFHFFTVRKKSSHRFQSVWRKYMYVYDSKFHYAARATTDWHKIRILFIISKDHSRTYMIIFILS
jgi:hypothetical protein